MLILAFALAFAGAASLALAIDRHWRAAFAERPQARRERILLRITGAVFLGESLSLALEAEPLGVAILVWATEVMLAAGVVAIAFAMRSARQ